MTTTSPRAIGLPLTRRSTGSPAIRSRGTTDPSRSSSVSATEKRARPGSTLRSTGTALSRRRSAKASAAGARASPVSLRGSKSTASVMAPPSLNRDVGEQHPGHLDVGSGLDLVEDLLLEMRAAGCAEQRLRALVGDGVGDD